MKYALLAKAFRCYGVVAHALLTFAVTTVVTICISMEWMRRFNEYEDVILEFVLFLDIIFSCFGHFLLFSCLLLPLNRPRLLHLTVSASSVSRAFLLVLVLPLVLLP